MSGIITKIALAVFTCGVAEIAIGATNADVFLWGDDVAHDHYAHTDHSGHDHAHTEISDQFNADTGQNTDAQAPGLDCPDLHFDFDGTPHCGVH